MESQAKQLEEIIRSMSLEEKIGQLRIIPLYEQELPKYKEMIRHGQIGSFILSATPVAGNEKERQYNLEILDELQRIATEESPHGIPLLYGKDIIHGAEVVYPIPLAQAASWNAELVEEAAERMTSDAKTVGVHWTFAPMLDISRDSRWGRIIESFGEDPYLTSEFARASVRGIQGDFGEHNMAACAKHFLGYGLSDGGRDYHTTDTSDYTMRNIYLPPFRAAVEEGVATVMNSFGEIGGEGVSCNEYLLKTVLKDEVGFRGFTVSDWGSVRHIYERHCAETEKEAAKKAFLAGMDMEMSSECYVYLKELVEEGIVSTTEIDDAVRRILALKQKLGLFSKPYIKGLKKKYSTEENLDFSETFARECAVLLKNENHTLPLSNEKCVSVIGAYKDDKLSVHGSWSNGNAELTVTFVEALKGILGDNRVFDDPNNFEDTYYLYARKADTVILVIGEYYGLTGERNCMSSVEVSDYYVKIARFAKYLGKKVIAVVFAGRPLVLTELLPYTDALLYAWHSGTMGPKAAADLLFGNAVPCGKLPVSMARSTGQMPIYYNYRPGASHDNSVYYYQESRLYPYQDELSTPLFPFGYGLSYTEFSYSGVKCLQKELTYDEIIAGRCFEISVNVRNNGKYDAKEIVQCYINDSVSEYCRPVRELKGFCKIFLRAGEEKTVKFSIGFRELGYCKNKTFDVEKGEFNVYCGSSCMAEEFVSIKIK